MATTVVQFKFMSKVYSFACQPLNVLTPLNLQNRERKKL